MEALGLMGSQDQVSLLWSMVYILQNSAERDWALKVLSMFQEVSLIHWHDAYIVKPAVVVHSRGRGGRNKEKNRKKSTSTIREWYPSPAYGMRVWQVFVQYRVLTLNYYDFIFSWTHYRFGSLTDRPPLFAGARGCFSRPFFPPLGIYTGKPLY